MCVCGGVVTEADDVARLEPSIGSSKCAISSADLTGLDDDAMLLGQLLRSHPVRGTGNIKRRDVVRGKFLGGEHVQF